MQLLDTLRFRRNSLGYVEETCISIYHEWVRGMQYFVIHPHQNETNDPYGAQRYGMYTLDYQAVKDFMKVFRESWTTGTYCEIPENVTWQTRSRVYDSAYSMNETSGDENTYRIIVREQHWQLFDDRFVVGNLKYDGERPVLLELRGRKNVRAMLFPLEHARLVAANLTCINIESIWCSTNRQLFTDPELVIQRALETHAANGVIREEHWEDHSVERFIAHDYILKFNGDFTDATVVKIN